MQAIAHQARRALQSLNQVLVADEHPQTVAALSALNAAMVEELDIAPFLLDGVELEPSPKRGCTEVARLQKALWYQRKRRKDAEDNVERFSGQKRGGQIQNIWFARVAMTQPTVAAEELRQ